MSVSQLSKKLGVEYKRGFEEIKLVGNAFAHPEFPKLMHVFGKLGLQSLVVEVPSNVSLAPHIKSLKSGRATGVVLCASDISASSNDALLGKGSFAKLEKNLSTARKSGMEVEINFIVTKKNWVKLPDIIEFYREKGVYLHFNELMPLGDVERAEKMIMSREESRRFWNAVVGWKDNNPVNIGGHSNLIDNSEPCQFFDTVYINEAGLVQTCPLDQYFRSSGVKRKNNPQNTHCGACFKWVNPKDGYTKGKKTCTAKDQLVKEVFMAYESLKDKKAASSFKAGDFSKEMFTKKNFDSISDAFGMIKRLETLKVNWVDNYHASGRDAVMPLNNKSNLRYRFCRKESSKTLPLKDALQSLNELDFCGQKNIFLAGGDILLYPHLKKLLKELDKKKFAVSLMLDGWNFKKHKAFILRSKIRALYFNVFGSTPEMHDKEVGVKGAFTRIMDNLEDLLEAEAGSPIMLGFNYILTEKNFSQLEQLIDFAGMLNAEAVNIVPVQDFCVGVKLRYIPSPKTMSKVNKLCLGGGASKSMRLGINLFGKSKIFQV